MESDTIANYLTESGGAMLTPTAISFGETPEDYHALSEQTVCVPLTHQGVLSVDGAKGAQLLQGQVTCDINQLNENSTLRGAQCTPQGRMLATFNAFQLSDERRLLQMNRLLVDPLIDYLSKYAVFFQTSLHNASDDVHSFGITGEHADEVIADIFGDVPASGQVIHNQKSEDGSIASQISSRQYQILAPSDRAATIWRQLLATSKPAGTDFWNLNSIAAGLGEVTPETVETFIPQMLNLQATGAISFKKGCYTGQEIVARTRYRGKLKKRLYRLTTTLEQLPAPGTPCLLPEGNRRIGEVSNAAWRAPSHVELLAVLNNDAATTGQMIFGDLPPSPCQLLDLPYPLDD